MKKRISHLMLVVMALLVALTTSLPSLAQTNKWRDIYTVKKKDTLFGICREYGISMPQLLEANPEMKAPGYMLKKGTTIFIPFGSADQQATQDTKVTAKPQAVKTEKATVRVGVVLPLHNINGDGRRMVEYYRGLLMGCDSLRQQGISTDIHAWNMPIDGDIKTVISDPQLAKVDVIFGPLYTHQVQPLAEFCKARNIKLVIPFSISGDDVSRYSQIFQVWESPDKLNNDAIEAYLKRFPTAHTVFVDCNDEDSKKGVFTMALRNRLQNLGRSFNITNLTSSEDVFAKAFRNGRQNVIVLNSATSPNLTVAMTKIESLKALVPGLQTALFGYTEWLMYADLNATRFYAMDTYIPANFYYNALDPRTRRLEQSYRRWFGQDMQYALPHFAITGYDHAQFFLRGIHQHGADFRGTRQQSQYRPLQSPLVFQQVGSAGMQNQYFQLIHYTPQQQMESIAY